MSVLTTIVLAAEEAKIALIFPIWIFPLIAIVVFVGLGLVVWSFRDVANRHSQKTGGSAASGHTANH